MGRARGEAVGGVQGDTSFRRIFFYELLVRYRGAKRGIRNAALLFHSVDTKAFHPVDCNKRYDWCFVGGRSDVRQRFIEEALAVSPNGVIYGPKWLKKISSIRP